MGFRLLLVIAALVVFIAAGCSNKSTAPNTNVNSTATASPAKPDEFATIRVAYEKDCAVCHQKTGVGGPVKLEDGTKLKVPNLCEGHALKHPDSDFVKQITKGGDGMPAFGEKMSRKECDEMVRFIRHQFQGGMMPMAADATKSSTK